MAFEWTPVISTAGALAGVLIGNNASSRRERNKISKEEEFKSQAHWRDKKLEIYTDLLEQFARLLHSCDGIVNEHKSEQEHTSDVSNAQILVNSITLLGARVRLLAPQEIFESYEKIGWSSYTLLVVSLETIRDRNWDNTEQQKARDIAGRQLEDLTSKIQADLKITFTQ